MQREFHLVMSKRNNVGFNILCHDPNNTILVSKLNPTRVFPNPT
jgi:hypothetical protein